MRRLLFMSDYDSTLTIENDGARLFNYFIEQGWVNNKQQQLRRDSVMWYREGKISYNDMIMVYGDLVADVWRGRTVKDVYQVVRDYYTKNSKLFPTVKKTFEQLQRLGFERFILSGSVQELIGLAATELSAMSHGSYIDSKDGVYSGRAYFLNSQRKGKVAAGLASGAWSIGVGDSVGDLGMLRKVDVAIVWNAKDPELKMRITGPQLVLEASPDTCTFYDVVMSGVGVLNSKFNQHP